MKILVIGSGGREHALCWKLKAGKDVEKVYCAPGNAGIAQDAECVDIPVDNLDALAEFAKKTDIDLTVVGPEVPLCAGITDKFRGAGLRIFGPDKNGARLEGSKAFAKDFMDKYGIPTAEAASFTSKDKACAYVKEKIAGKPGIVVKADGLAAGKGVIVATTEKEALDGIDQCFSGEFGKAGESVLIEEMLIGEEASILALTDGITITPLASSQDHKRVGEGDTGLNTGGMGAYSPAPVVTDELMAEIKETVLDRFLEGIKKEKMDFRGIIYAGVMVTENGPKILEFNVRFGDPETQAVLMRLESDLADVMTKTADKSLDQVNLEWSKEPAVCIVMAAGGYPGSYNKGDVISGLAEAAETGAVVFHAGTTLKDENIATSGGRVLGVTAKGANIADAASNAYKAVEKISWDGAFYRKDIAYRAL
jgi:phosphoribosylamine--glycine ligase